MDVFIISRQLLHRVEHQGCVIMKPTVARMLWIDSPMPPADLEIAAHSFSVSKMPCSTTQVQLDAAT